MSEREIAMAKRLLESGLSSPSSCLLDAVEHCSHEFDPNGGGRGAHCAICDKVRDLGSEPFFDEEVA